MSHIHAQRAVFKGLEKTRHDGWWKKQEVLQQMKGNRSVTARNRYQIAVRYLTKGLLLQTRAKKLKKEIKSDLVTMRLSSALDEHKIPMSVFMNGLHNADVVLSRRMCVMLSLYEPRTFEQLVELAERTQIEMAWGQNIELPERCLTKKLVD